MNIEKRRAEIAARKAEIRKLLTDDKNADIDALEKELRELNEEDAGLEKRQAIERMLNSGSATGNPIENPVAARSLPVEDTEKLYRSAWLKTLQGKSLTDDEKRVYEQRAYSTAANSALPIIPETTANQIIKKMYEVAPILQRWASRITTTTSASAARTSRSMFSTGVSMSPTGPMAALTLSAPFRI